MHVAHSEQNVAGRSCLYANSDLICLIKDCLLTSICMSAQPDGSSCFGLQSLVRASAPQIHQPVSFASVTQINMQCCWVSQAPICNSRAGDSWLFVQAGLHIPCCQAIRAFALTAATSKSSMLPIRMEPRATVVMGGHINPSILRLLELIKPPLTPHTQLSVVTLDPLPPPAICNNVGGTLARLAHALEVGRHNANCVALNMPCTDLLMLVWIWSWTFLSRRQQAVCVLLQINSW